MRFAYADPPYLGQSRRLYGALHDDADAYDDIDAHRALLERLCDEYPDGWCYSLSSSSLAPILAVCPVPVRVCAWVKAWCSYKRPVSPAYTWEPVLLAGGRAQWAGGLTVRDAYRCSVATGGGMPGAKPLGFCRWVFALLGARPGDDLDDLFPGSGAVSRAWAQWCEQPALPIAVVLEQLVLEGIVA